MSEKELKEKVVQVFLPLSLWESIVEMAGKEGISVSAFLRRAAMREVAP